MARVAEYVLDHSQSKSPGRYGRPKLTLPEAQQQIFDFLLSIVREWPPEDVLHEFEELFFHSTETTGSGSVSALYTILFANNPQEFHNTLKRSCYILVNNWEVNRQYEAICTFVALFDNPLLQRHTLSPTLKRLREWLYSFSQSEDYRELRLFASRFSEEAREQPWSARYASYLLVPQYTNVENPIEQREAARALSRRLKDKFKFELAMYTAHSQASVSRHRKLRNPTKLGDSVLRLIKALVARRGEFSHRNLAHLFLEQVKELHYRDFKKSLLEYLVYSVHQADLVKALKQHLGHKLDALYPEHDESEVDRSLQLRTCNRLIDHLMTEDKRTPSQLFTLMLSQGSSLFLAIVLLKLILICRSAHPYLEARIADLIRYYEQFPQEQCAWVINFLEVFQVTFAIYAENVEYNLISPETSTPEQWTLETLEACRVFSRMVRGYDLEGDRDSNDVTES